MSTNVTITNNPSRLDHWQAIIDDSEDVDANMPYNVIHPGDAGDKLQEQKEEGTTRIYFQNLNGIKWDKEGGTWPQICHAMANINADIIGFAEINQDTTKYEVEHQIETIAKKHFDHSRITTSTSKRQVRRTYKPGGTMMMTVMNSVSMIEDTTRDRMGRWVSMRYRGTTAQRVTVITSYQVSQNTRTGVNTAVNQQMNMIIEESAALGIDQRIKPREAFIRDLQLFIQQRQEEGDNIILVGDFNETILDPHSGIAQLMEACGLVDIFSQKLGNSHGPSTYKRGTRRIDFSLVSPTIVPCITSLGYEPFDYRGIHSDHRGLFIDMDTKTLFGNNPNHLAPAAYRDFTTDQPAKVTQYIETKYEELNHHNIKRRIAQLENLTEADHVFAERLDADISRASRIAAKRVKATRQSPWSPDLARTWATIHLLLTLKSQILNPHLDNWETIHTWRQKYKVMTQEALPTTIAEIKQRLREAREKLKEIRQNAEELRQQYLDQKADVYAMTEDIHKAKILRRIKRAEALKKCYRKIQFIRREPNGRGLSEIQVPADPTMDPKQCPKDNAYWRTVQTPDEITQLLIRRNRIHFGQAQGTPLTEPAIMAQVHYDGTGEAVDMILDGHYQPQNLDEASQKFINHMQRKTLQELSPHLTTEEFIGKLKSWPDNHIPIRVAFRPLPHTLETT